MNTKQNKILLGKKDFYSKLVESIEDLSNLVKITLGPDGLPILLERNKMSPLVTKDGVTVAKNIFLKDPIKNQIVEAIREASLKTNEIAGDGTTTAIILTEAIIKESIPYLVTNQITPQRLAKSLGFICEKLNKNLKEMSFKINDDLEKLKEIAYISCNGDEDISQIIVEAFDKVGIDGVVTLEENLDGFTTLSIEEGFSINKGLSSLNFANSNKAERIFTNNKLKSACEYHNAAVILYSGIVDDVQDLFTAISQITNNGVDNIPIVVFALDFIDPVVDIALLNIQKAGLKILLVKIPMLGIPQSQSQLITDLASLTGGKILYPERNAFSKILNSQSDYLGGVDRIISLKDKTFVYGGKGSSDEVKRRADEIRVDLTNSTNEFERQIHRERLGRMVGGICVVSVGGITDLEAKEKKDRIEDALNAVKVSLEDGVLPGGGTALLKAFFGIDVHSFSFDKILNEDKKIAYDIFSRVVEYPLIQLVKNGEIDKPDVILNRVKDDLKLANALKDHESGDKWKFSGYDARQNKVVENVVESGIIDPLKVTLTALNQATSISKMMLITGGAIVDDPSFQKSPEEVMNSLMSNNI